MSPTPHAPAEPDARDVPGVDPRERIYAVGDLHGRHDLLLAMLTRIEADAARFDDGRQTRLVMLGDYVDRGDDSARVIEILAEISAARGCSVDCLMGNHEAAMLAFLADPVHGRAWLDFGAAQTLASFGIGCPGVTDDPAALGGVRDALVTALGPRLGFLQALPSHIRSGDVVFAHAGLNPEGTARFSDAHAMLWGAPGFLVPQPIPGLRVVHGHYDRPEPEVHPGRVGVDTGAYHTGRLTAVRLDAGEALITVNTL